MRPLSPSIHANFFSSLRQVEKRLKLEHPSQPPTPSSPQPPQPPPPPPPPPHQQQNPAPPPPPESNYTSTESLSTPIYLNLDQPTNSSSSILQDSEPPQQFLSNSPDFPPTHEDPPQPNNEQTMNEVDTNGIDSIELLIQLLGLSDCKEEEQQWVGLGLENGGGDRGCDEEFLAKIVGRKGPKCGKDVERLEGWIKHFLNDGGEEKIEPLRLAHLLLGKTAFVSEDSDGFGGFEFPSTIEEFLQNDPPEE
ncbi:uncharacterized protein LOC132311391 [Cornus florida]|uniref:uncharacterized protein LOC132311391 n=1 Tax=Cornus florida TaxID=4283 RepID=UPI002897250D|nr:uncharacterized protein LOC132311391 [Cornus florida]